jgi:uncharacterized protein (TIRG00374 family)
LDLRKVIASPKLRNAAVVLLAFVLLWLFLRGTDLAALSDSLWKSRPIPIFLAVLATLVGYLIRAVRWQVMLSPLGRPGLYNCFVFTVIGFTVNFLLFGRLGEIARPYLLARQEGFSASGAFATIFLERVLDLVTVVLLIGFWLLVGPLPTESEEALSALQFGGALGLGGAALLFAVLFFFARFPETAMRLVSRITGLLPEKLGDGLTRFAELFASGLRVLVDFSGFVKSAVLSLVLWLSIVLAFWLGAVGLDVHFSFGSTFLVIGFLTIGVAVPTPGAVGGYHVMAALALTMLFGVDPTPAKAVAIVNHAISFVPVSVLGILFFMSTGISLRQVKSF